jgi:hypothetical protein
MPALVGYADRPAALDRPAPSPSALRRAAARVLRQNWTGAATVPSRGLYPHQWSWDSAFIAIGLRHLDPARARRELETLCAAQWGDGRVPHIVFAPQVPTAAYFPSPDFWRSAAAGAAAGAPAGPQTSGIVQPPVHALAAWLVHRADPAGSARHGFLARLYPRLDAWQRYLTTRRDLGGAGLAAIVHPWESGMDNSPCWDGPLSRITPADPTTFRRADLDHGAAEDRPTDLDYGRYVALAAGYRDGGYADDLPPPFAVEDPGLNSLLITAEHALADIAAELGGGHRAAARLHRARAARGTRALVDRLWSPHTGMFHSRDLVSGELLAPRSAAGLLPLLLPGLPARQAAGLLRALTGEHFGLGRATGLVPGYDLLGPAFHRRRYWRGPAWFNVNWLLVRGLRQQGAHQHAEALRARMLHAAGASGFAEYLDPYTEQPYGARPFSWTAALTVDLLAAPGSIPAGPGTPTDTTPGAAATASAATPDAATASAATAARRQGARP